MNKPAGGRWTLPLLLRFEQYLSHDKTSDEAAISPRDRALYQALPEAQRSRPAAYLSWLQARILKQPLQPDAAIGFVRAYQGAAWLIVVAGLLMGALVCFGALNYERAAPVNVAIFLALIVLPQLLLLALLVLSVLLSLLGSGWFSAWYRPAVALGQRVIAALWRQPGGEQSVDTSVKQELIRQSFALHGGIFATRVLRLFQVMGIAFNAGVVISLLLLLAITDRAFGWQSSLTDSPQVVASIVNALAWPWRDIWGVGVGLPSAEQIAYSRIVLDAAGLDYQGAAVKAWWPFLLLCVVFYGFLPRLLVYLFALLRERWLLARISFDSYHYQALWRRMQSLELRSAGQSGEHAAEASASHTPMSSVANGIATAYVLTDTLSRYRRQYLAAWLSDTQTHTELAPVSSLAAIEPPASQSLYLIVEGWQPPIEEVLLAVVELARRLAQGQADLHLLLLGKPGAAGSKPLSPRQAEVWRKKLDIYQQANIIVHADFGADGEPL